MVCILAEIGSEAVVNILFTIKVIGLARLVRMISTVWLVRWEPEWKESVKNDSQWKWKAK